MSGINAFNWRGESTLKIKPVRIGRAVLLPALNPLYLVKHTLADKDRNASIRGKSLPNCTAP